MHPCLLVLCRKGLNPINSRWVYRVLWKKDSPETPVNKGGRPRKLDEKTARKLVRCTKLPCLARLTLLYPSRMKKQNPYVPLKQILSELGLTLPEQTARDYHRRAGLKGRRPARKPLMSLRNRLQWQQWCRQWAGYCFDQVLFTDEKKWVCVNKGPNFVWQPVGMRFHPRFCVPTKQAGGGSVMVWGAITRKRVYPLVRIPNTLDGQGYVDLLNKFFKEQAVGPAGRLRGAQASRPRLPWVFQQDNAAIHRSKVAEGTLKRWKVQVLPWPAQSPDLSPIENLWSLVSKRLQGRVFSNPDQLWEAVQREWNAIDASTLATLYNTMPSRMAAVRKAHGFPTKY